MPEIYNSNKNKKRPRPEGKKPPKSKIAKKRPSTKRPKGKSVHKASGHSHNPFFSYSMYPDKVKFINRDPEEKVILLLRRHLLTNLGWLLLALVMVIAPAFLSAFTFVELLPGEFQIVFMMIWYLMIIAFILERFLLWYFNVNIVTDERIIDVDFTNLFFREMTDANIDQIQDVTVEVGGGVKTFFSYGDVIIQTAAEIPKIRFEEVPHPDKVSRVLRDLRIEEEVEKLEGRVR